ncbi:MAG: CU044_2847 family protein [Pseudomonadota bacterium]
MADFVELLLPSGGIVHVQSSLSASDRKGVHEASGVVQKAHKALAEAMGAVQEIADVAISQITDVTKQAEEVRVEFGVNLSSKAGVILVEGETGANLKVSVLWKRDS